MAAILASQRISFFGNLQSQPLERRNQRRRRLFQPSHQRTRTTRCSTQTPQMESSDAINKRRRSGSRSSRPQMVLTTELKRRSKTTEGEVSVKVNGKEIKGERKEKEKEKEKEMRVFGVDENFGWSTESYSLWRRSLDIWGFLISLRLRITYDNDKWTYFKGFSKEKQERRRRRTALWLREQALQLGPTFIKFAQFFSTRSDLLPMEYIEQLAKLQDKVPAFSHETARKFIETELEAPINVLFKEFEDQPIAAASLGQVHRAVLHNGENVVVKVQRPGLKNLFDIDLRNMKLLADYFQRRELLEGSNRNWLAIYDDCSRLLYQEIDYISEGKSADRFRRDFRNIKWVRVPLVYWDYTSEKVLTMEYVPGVKINDLDSLEAKGHSRSQIASKAIESYMIQILNTGFVHADPHPGNIAIDADGSLVYYDFGMMGEIKTFTRERLLELFFAVYENDVKKVARSLVALEIVQPTEDMVSLQRSIQYFMNKLLNQKEDRQQTLAAIGDDLLSTARDQPICFPSTFIYILKAFTTIEGIGYALDPQFSFAKCASPYIEELVNMRQSQLSGAELVDGIRKQADDVRSNTLSVPYRIQQIEGFVKQLDSGDLKLHVRVLESEKAARKASILQMGTIYLVLGGILLNTGITLSSIGAEAVATGFFVSFGIFLILSIESITRMQKLDKTDKRI